MKKLILSLTTLTAVMLIITGCGASNKNTASSSSTTKESSTATASSSSSPAVDVNSLDLPQLNPEVAENEDLVEIVTTEGNIKIKLFPEQAPKAVENFITHAKDGYYNGVTFHRVIKDFMIQGGDPKGDGTGGASIWDKEFVPEISNQLYHINGALAMARTGLPIDQPSQGSQFYIVQNDQDQSAMAEQVAAKNNFVYPDKIKEAYKKGGVPFLDTQYSVFGQVLEGLDVVKKIGETETAAGDKPVKDIKVEKITILKEAK